MAIFHVQFHSTTLKRTVPLVVCLPTDINPLTAYKTLYLLHGHSGCQTDWLYKTTIDELSTLHNLAVVMPAGENSFYLDHLGQEALFSQFIGEELIHFTRNTFPLSKEREDTIIGGLSMGGYGALVNGLKYHQVFGSIIGLSSALVTDMVHQMKEGETYDFSYDYCKHLFGEPSQVLSTKANPKLLCEDLISENATLPKLYLACGTEDFLLPCNRDFTAFLHSIGYAHEYIEDAGDHDWKFWQTYIEKALRWYIQGISII